MITRIKLDARLAAAAELCGAGSVADIGTDHALLPIALVQAGAPRAFASDIHEGPCARARVNIAAYGLSDRIRVVCQDGLANIEEFKPDNIVIAGMGGELIADILAASDYPKASGCRLILQPMTMHAELRKFLAHGYVITEERVVCENHKYYQLLAAHYDGVRRTFTETEYRLGKLNLLRAECDPTSEDLAWLSFVRARTHARIAGRAVAALDNEAQEQDRAMLETIKGLLEKKSE